MDEHGLTTENRTPLCDSRAAATMDNYELIAADGIALSVSTYRCVAPIKARVVLTHGRGEHSRRYSHVGAAMAAKGVQLMMYDLRGHGRSGGPRGDVPSYEALLDDLASVVRHAREKPGPVYLMGHSLGGQITLNFVSQHKPDCAGAVITSPYLRLAFAPARWRVTLARVARSFWPGLIQHVPLAGTALSRDSAHLESLPDLDLLHHRISVRMYYEMERGAASALEHAPEFQMPLLLIHGSADAVTSVEATREFYERAGSADKKLSLYPGMLHEPLNDLGREQVIEEITDWILSHTAGTSALPRAMSE